MEKPSEVEWDGRRGGDKGSAENTIYFSCTQHINILRHGMGILFHSAGQAEAAALPFCAGRGAWRTDISTKFFCTWTWTVRIFSIAFYRLLPDAYLRAASLMFPCFLHKGCEWRKNLHASYLRKVLQQSSLGALSSSGLSGRYCPQPESQGETSLIIPALDPPCEIRNDVKVFTKEMPHSSHYLTTLDQD